VISKDFAYFRDKIIKTKWSKLLAYYLFFQFFGTKEKILEARLDRVYESMRGDPANGIPNLFEQDMILVGELLERLSQFGCTIGMLEHVFPTLGGYELTEETPIKAEIVQYKLPKLMKFLFKQHES